METASSVGMARTTPRNPTPSVIRNEQIPLVGSLATHEISDGNADHAAD
jgi:hypothetical protein